MYSSVVAAPASRATLVSAVQTALGVDAQKADAIVTGFDDYVAKPLAANLTKLRGRDLAKRNPMIYTVRGVTSVDEWVDRVLEDKETSAIESHIGTWQEEVARIVSGGVKPGSGIDLQRDQPGNTRIIELYAIQSAPNTKSSGGRRSDVDALKKAAGALRASKRTVEMNIAVCQGGAPRVRCAPIQTSLCSVPMTSGRRSAAFLTSGRASSVSRTSCRYSLRAVLRQRSRGLRRRRSSYSTTVRVA